MGIIERKIKRELQAMAGVEGIKDSVVLESLLTGERLNTAISGVTNNYKNYEAQVDETYKKYNGSSDWGNQQLRAIIDFRVAFIAGEGISVTCPDESTSAWIEKFLEYNHLDGSFFINTVKATEMAGQTICKMKVLNSSDMFKNGPKIKVQRVPYNMNKMKYKPYFVDQGDMFSLIFKYKSESDLVEKTVSLENAIPIVTGGDDTLIYGPTTKVGLVLNDIENYDRAVKDIRRLNHILARITPKITCETQNEVKSTLQDMEQLKWKIGKLYVGTGDFDYATPKTGAHDNLITELVTAIKNISSVTGIPIHWLGYVDLMSNRATADTLYEVIKNATINERTTHAEAIYSLILKAQELYIDNGGVKISKINPEFEVKIPLIDYNSFYDRVRSLSVAFNDGAISMADYRNEIPGIDPLETLKQIEKEQEEEIKRFIPPEDLGENEGEENE